HSQPGRGLAVPCRQGGDGHILDGGTPARRHRGHVAARGRASAAGIAVRADRAAAVAPGRARAGAAGAGLDRALGRLQQRLRAQGVHGAVRGRGRGPQDAGRRPGAEGRIRGEAARRPGVRGQPVRAPGLLLPAPSGLGQRLQRLPGAAPRRAAALIAARLEPPVGAALAPRGASMRPSTPVPTLIAPALAALLLAACNAPDPEPPEVPPAPQAAGTAAAPATPRPTRPSDRTPATPALPVDGTDNPVWEQAAARGAGR